MELIEKLISIIPEEKVRDLVVGLGWTVVLSVHAGMAMTYRFNEEPRDVNSLHEMNTKELAQLLRSWNFLEASVGLAGINSALPIPKSYKIANALDLALQESEGKVVTMVGYFFPYVEKFREKAKRFYVLELNPNLVDSRKNVLYTFAAEEVIPKSDIVIFTATTIINKSIERLLQLSRSAKVYLVGPSTPMTDVLFDYGIDVIGGVRVKDEEKLVRVIKNGLCFPFSDFMRKHVLEEIVIE
ncbi:DUF364 domain-containing protein [Stygiolobus caldivivus]|nr:DUF364 domain-containing protein [Stygiolobus caldivivus]